MKGIPKVSQEEIEQRRKDYQRLMQGKPPTEFMMFLEKRCRVTLKHMLKEQTGIVKDITKEGVTLETSKIKQTKVNIGWSAIAEIKLDE